MLYNLLYNIMKSYFWRNPPAQACLPPAIDTDAANLFTTSERLIQEQYVQRLTELQSWKIWSKKSYTTQIFIILLRLIIVRLASQMHAKGLRAYRSSQEGCEQFKKSSILVLLTASCQLQNTFVTGSVLFWRCCVHFPLVIFKDQHYYSEMQAAFINDNTVCKGIIH